MDKLQVRIPIRGVSTGAYGGPTSSSPVATSAKGSCIAFYYRNVFTGTVDKQNGCTHNIFVTDD